MTTPALWTSASPVPVLPVVGMKVKRKRVFDAKAYGAAYREKHREHLRRQSAKCYAERKDIYLARQRERRAAMAPEERKAKDAAHWKRAKAKQTERERKMQRERAAKLRKTNAAFAARQRAGHRAWQKANLAHCREYAQSKRDDPSKSYVAQVLGMASGDVPQELYALKKAHLQLTRALRCHTKAESKSS